VVVDIISKHKIHMQAFDYLSYSGIDVNTILKSLKDPHSGGIVLFCGDVRFHNKGKEVQYLEYEAYEPMARLKIEEILNSAIKKWKLNAAVCVHRLGRLAICDTAVIVITSSIHRAEAYEANRYIIDRIKADVPIWKNEFFSDGSNEWGNNKDCTCADPKHVH
jgi:molybdopterin synthase catalytic subunit